MPAVVPKIDCPHVKDGVQLPFVVDLSIACKECGDASENWQCLQCHTIGCSRYVASHMSVHNDNTKHPLAVSFSDLSIWCYECDSYVSNPELHNIKVLYHLAKFGDDGAGGSKE